MQWPSLVPAAMCCVPVVLHLTDGINENGTPREVLTLATVCNYSGKAGWSMDAQRQLVKYTASALFTGDLAPQLQNLTGTATLLGGAMTISGFCRARNPDGTVNYVKLEFF
ncbi:MAG: hypothetical protein RSD23_06550 [Ruthenibacterium sp.]